MTTTNRLDEIARLHEGGYYNPASVHSEAIGWLVQQLREAQTALDAERETVQQLRDWRDRATAALRIEGDCRFEDVPSHIKTDVDLLNAVAEALEVGDGSCEWDRSDLLDAARKGAEAQAQIAQLREELKAVNDCHSRDVHGLRLDLIDRENTIVELRQHVEQAKAVLRAKEETE